MHPFAKGSDDVELRQEVGEEAAARLFDLHRFRVDLAGGILGYFHPPFVQPFIAGRLLVVLRLDCKDVLRAAE